MANELINYSERFAVMAKEATEVEVVRRLRPVPLH
jgi:hypothetical protein